MIFGYFNIVGSSIPPFFSLYYETTTNYRVKKSPDITDRRRIGEMIEENLDYLVRFAALRVGNMADAEDIVHEAVRRMLENDMSRVKAESVRMYLFRIVYNLCSDYFHSHSLSARHERLSEDDGCVIPDPAAGSAWERAERERAERVEEEELLDSEEIERLNVLLDSLPAREAEIIRMNVMDELSFAEISRILSIPPSTVKSRFKAGMDKLRKRYFKNQ